MNYPAAVSYLQSLITEPEGTLEDGSRDFGWCCSEHALVMSLALRLCGKSAIVAEGEVNIALTGEFPQWVYRHWFAVANATVYDSSIRFKGISGIYPGCAISVPVHFVQAADNRTVEARHEISYLQSRQHSPIQYRGVTSSTPYGKWLSANSVDHPRFWANASNIAADLLRNSIQVPIFTDRLSALEYTISKAG